MKCPREGCSWEGEPKDYITHLQQAHKFKKPSERRRPTARVTPLHPDWIKLVAPPTMIEDAQRCGFIEAIGIMLLKRVQHWATCVHEEIEGFRAGATTHEIAERNIDVFMWAINEDKGIAESLSVPEHIIRQIEIEHTTAQNKRITL